jgi:hypothetical protein
VSPRALCIVVAVVAIAVPGCGLIIGIEDGVLDPSLLEDAAGVVDRAAPDSGEVRDSAPAVVDATPDTSGVRCTESGAQQLGGHCYFVLPNAATYDQQKAACVGAGAHLVTITSDAERSFLTKSFGGERRWIGLQAPAATTDRAAFKWITNETSPYMDWQSDQPNGDGPCGALDGSGDDDWVDRYCGSTYQGICERE